ncbi:hypothetical protein B0O80DRAFT_384767, partial [Mortierella sp. GBAus27b]
IKWGLSGFGPRHALYLIYQAMVLLAYQDKLEANNIKFKLHYTVFEKQAVPSPGPAPGIGNAFQTDCDATVNTPVTKLPDFLGNTSTPAFQHLEKFANLERTMYPTLMADYHAILDNLKKRNPAAAAMFEQAFGSLDPKDYPKTPCMTRGKWGTIQAHNINKALEYIRDYMGDSIQFEVYYSHEVTGVDFSKPDKPVIKFLTPENGKDERVFDFVSFAHGTRLVSSVKSDVAQHAYERAPNHDTMRKYLEGRRVTEYGYLKPDVKIACTGLGLSFYDYMTLLIDFIPGIRECDDPAAFLEQNKAKYQGLITVISHGKSGPAPPRNALDPDWCGGQRSFFSARDMHALRLQSNSSWLPMAYEFLEAHIARALGKKLSEVNASVSVKDFAERYHKDNLQFPHSAATETGLLRAGYASFSIGTGIVHNVQESERHLTHEAPLSRSGRLGFPMYSAGCYEISSAESFDTDANTEFFKHWTQQMFFNYASPVPLQDIMNTLFTTGIAKHEEGGFEGIGYANGKFTFGNANFDALLSPMKFDSKRDRVFSAPVKILLEGVPDYGKGGYFQTVNGGPINAFDAGMGSSGTQVIKAGKRRTAAVQTSTGITNNHAASCEWASHHAYHTLALAVASCHFPSRSPIQIIGNIMRAKNHEKAEEFRLEVNKFGPDWDDLQDRLVFLRLAAHMARDNFELYRDITDRIFSKETRESFINGLTGDHKNKYLELATEKQGFMPPTMFQFERRFPDYTKVQYEEILEVIFRHRAPIATDQSHVHLFKRTDLIATTVQSHVHPSPEEAEGYDSQGVFDLPYKVDFDRNYAFIF